MQRGRRLASGGDLCCESAPLGQGGVGCGCLSSSSSRRGGSRATPSLSIRLSLHRARACPPMTDAPSRTAVSHARLAVRPHCRPRGGRCGRGEQGEEHRDVAANEDPEPRRCRIRRRLRAGVPRYASANAVTLTTPPPGFASNKLLFEDQRADIDGLPPLGNANLEDLETRTAPTASRRALKTAGLLIASRQPPPRLATVHPQTEYIRILQATSVWDRNLCLRAGPYGNSHPCSKWPARQTSLENR
jgi:hypothetical protein